MDFKEMASNLGMAEDEFEELVDLFVATTRSDIAKMEGAIESGSSEEIARAAHSVKGAAANLGFEALAGTAKEIEMKAGAEDMDAVLDSLDLLREKLEKIAADG